MSRGEAIDRRVVVDSCDFLVEVVGEGIPVVLVHGLGASSVLWNRVRDGLAPDYQVVLVDLRGAGETREIDRKELSLETWASDLAALLGALGIERPVLVGHSLGASVALQYVLSRPDDVRALVLIAADANLSNLAPRMLKAAGLIGDVGLPDWIDEHWSKNPPFSAASLAREPELLDEYRSMLLLNDPDDYVRQCLAIANAEDLSGRLGEVRRPALVIVGGEALDLGPGDICFIPRNTPHRITGVSDEDLVILWAFGGAASIEQAGYVPLPD